MSREYTPMKLAPEPVGADEPALPVGYEECLDCDANGELHRLGVRHCANCGWSPVDCDGHPPPIAPEPLAPAKREDRIGLAAFQEWREGELMPYLIYEGSRIGRILMAEEAAWRAWSTALAAERSRTAALVRSVREACDISTWGAVGAGMSRRVLALLDAYDREAGR